MERLILVKSIWFNIMKKINSNSSQVNNIQLYILPCTSFQESSRVRQFPLTRYSYYLFYVGVCFDNFSAFRSNALHTFVRIQMNQLVFPSRMHNVFHWNKKMIHFKISNAVQNCGRKLCYPQNNDVLTWRWYQKIYS